MQRNLRVALFALFVIADAYTLAIALLAQAFAGWGTMELLLGGGLAAAALTLGRGRYGMKLLACALFALPWWVASAFYM